MENYHWPGNIRELENLMRRTVLRTTTNIVNEFYHQPETIKVSTATEKLKCIINNERDHIVAALKSCNWKVYGLGGAEELLNIHASTLQNFHYLLKIFASRIGGELLRIKSENELTRRNRESMQQMKENDFYVFTMNHLKEAFI